MYWWYLEPGDMWLWPLCGIGGDHLTPETIASVNKTPCHPYSPNWMVCYTATSQLKVTHSMQTAAVASCAVVHTKKKCDEVCYDILRTTFFPRIKPSWALNTVHRLNSLYSFPILWVLNLGGNILVSSVCRTLPTQTLPYVGHRQVWLFYIQDNAESGSSLCRTPPSVTLLCSEHRWVGLICGQATDESDSSVWRTNAESDFMAGRTPPSWPSRPFFWAG